METKYQTVKIGKVLADENQPRKNFDPSKLHQLQESIKKEGIISPLIVEKVGDNYLLVDGERRLRAAQAVGLKEVPVLVEEAGNKISRLTRQFVVQEQHENWNPSEKANALIGLSEEIGVSVYEVCKLLNVSEGDINRYVAFSQLADRDNWVRNEIPVEHAVGLRSLRNGVRRIYETNFKKEFTQNDAKRLEKRVIQSIKDGTVTKKGTLIHLKDAFVRSPKLIDEYLNNLRETPTAIFLKSEAQGATALRNMMMQASYARKYGETYLQHRDVKISDEQLKILKAAHEVVGKVIASAE